MSPIAVVHPNEVALFLQASLCALIRAEVEGRVPPRFTGTGPDVWATFRNELTAADLAALAIQDAGVSMPVPFAPELWWPEWPEWGLLRQASSEVQSWMDTAAALAEQPRDTYLRAQARLLGLVLPPDQILEALRLPARHEQWLELPCTSGWVAYTLCSRPDAELYFWDNFTVICASPVEMLFAGLIAWELGAPPNSELHIRLDDADLSGALKSGATYHEVVGAHSLHAHRDLRILHRDGSISVVDMKPTATGGPYGPVTKSIDISEALMLIGLARQLPDVHSWREELMVRLPQASRQRRQEIVHDVQTKFLETEGDHFANSPLAMLVAMQRLDGKLRRDLLLAQYLRATPLVWEAARDVVLPHAEAGARHFDRANGGEITLEDWSVFLTGRLNTSTPSTVEKTRNHITAHLTKFGLLEARAVPGDRIAKRFYARFYEPVAQAFWFSLALEFDARGWTSRSLDFVSNTSWTRIAYCAPPAFVRFAVEEAERAGLVVTDFFGSEKQVTLRGPEPVAKITEAILRE